MTRRHDYHHTEHANRALSDHEDIAMLFPSIVELAKREGNHAIFQIERPEDDDDETRSFSAEAIHALHQEMVAFIVSRVMRTWDTTKHAPKILTVDVHVKVR